MFRSICAMFMATWLLLNPAVAVFAQAETTAPVSAVVPDKEKLIADYGALAGDLAISASDKQDAKQLFELILTTLVSINDLEKKNRLSVQAAAEYPGKIEALTQELAVDYKEFVGLDASVGNTTLEVEQLIRETQAELSQLHSMIAEAETHDASFEKRNSEIAARHKELAGLRDRLAAEGLLYVGDSPLIRLRQDCNALVLRQYAAEDEKLTSENNEMLAARSYWPKVIVSCDRRVDYLDKKLSALQKRLTKLRRETMENDLKIQAEKDQELLQRWPELGDLVRRNADSYALQLAPRSAQVQLSEYTDEVKTVSDMVDTVAQYRLLLRERLASTGIDHGSGIRLMEQNNRLPGPAKLDKEWSEVRGDLQTARYLLLAMDEDKLSLSNLLQTARAEFDELDRQKKTQASATVLVPEITKLLRQRYLVLRDLSQSYTQLVSVLYELDNLYSRLNDNLRGMRRELSEQLFWAHVSAPLSLGSLQSAARGVLFFFQPQEWVALAYGLYDTMPAGQPQYVALLIVLVMALLYWVPRVKRRILLTGAACNDRNEIPFYISVKGLIYTALVPFLTSMFFYGIALRLQAVAEFPQDVLASHFYTGFRYGAPVAWAFLFVYYLCLAGGFGERHLGWHAATCHFVGKTTLRAFRWLIVLKLCFGCYLAASDLLGNEVLDYDIRVQNVLELNRLAFAVMMVIVVWYVWRLLDPRRGVLRIVDVRVWPAEVRASKLFALRCVQLLALSVALASLWSVVFGYELAALALYNLLFYSLSIFTVVTVVNGLLSKYLLSSQRKMIGVLLHHLTPGKDSVMFSATRLEPEPEPESSVDMEGVALSEQGGDSGKLVYLRQLYVRTMRMTSIVVWSVGVLIWATWSMSCAPALDRFGNIELWSVETTEVMASMNATSKPVSGLMNPVSAVGKSDAKTTGTTKVDGGQSLSAMLHLTGDVADAHGDAVTVYDLLLALLLFFGSFFCAKYLKDLMELLLQQMPLTVSSRYAICAISGYVVVVGGVVWALNLLGVTWISIQWIVAAATVGLGFGLQDLFANLVSGLIILVEQPVRVGDIVTVNGTTGRVMGISMRCTIIRDFDLKEMIVPNKTLITGAVINSSLTSNIQRESIELVCMRTDVESDEMCRLITEKALATHGVMIEPAPMTLLTSIDKERKFTLWYYVDTKSESELSVRSRLYSRIREELRDYLYS